MERKTRLPKTSRLLMLPGVVAAVVMTSAGGLEQLTDQSEPTASDPEIVLGEAAFAIAQSYAEVDSVWPGAWPFDQRVVLGVERGRTLLLGPRIEECGCLMPAKFRSQTLDDGHPLIWDMPDQQLDSRLDFDFRIGSHVLFSSTIIPTLTHFEDSLSATLVFLYHEHFHKYQWDTFAEAFDVGALEQAMATHPTRIISEAEEKRLMGLERDLLRSALVTEASEEVATLLKSYFQHIEERAVRALRAGEEYAERFEGTATYFSYLATGKALGLPTNEVEALFLRDLEHTYPEDVGRGIEGVRNWHKYAVGAAKSLLASRMIPNWQSRVEAGETLDDLLVEWVQMAREEG